MADAPLIRAHSRRRRLVAAGFVVSFVLALGYCADSVSGSSAGAQPTPTSHSTPVPDRAASLPSPTRATVAPVSQARVRPLRDHARRTSYRIPASPAPATPGTDTTSGQSRVPQYRTNASDRSTANERSSGRSTTRSSSTGRSTAKTSSTGYANQSFAYSVLAQLNSERAAHGKRALTMNGELIVSAHAHNLAMARADQMSHQLPGEAYFADRISAAGYQYRNAGENIGWNSAVSRSGALALESDMYAEGPPPRGIVNHYSNIVSSNYANVGIEVWIDTVHDKLWLTEDFGGH